MALIGKEKKTSVYKYPKTSPGGKTYYYKSLDIFGASNIGLKYGRPTEKILQPWIDAYLKQNGVKSWEELPKGSRAHFRKKIIPKLKVFLKESKGFIPRSEMAKLLGVEPEYLGNIRRHTKEVSPLLSRLKSFLGETKLLRTPLIEGIGQELYYKRPSKEAIASFKKTLSADRLMDVTIKRINMFMGEEGSLTDKQKKFRHMLRTKSLTATDFLPTLQEMYPKADLTPNKVADSILYITRASKGDNILGLENISKNIPLSRLLLKQFEKAKWGNPLNTAAYRHARIQIDQQLGAKTGTFKSYQKALRNTLKNLGIKKFKNYQVDEIVGIRVGGGQQVAPYSTFTRYLTKVLNQDFGAPYQGLLSKGSAELGNIVKGDEAAIKTYTDRMENILASLKKQKGYSDWNPERVAWYKKNYPKFIEQIKNDPSKAAELYVKDFNINKAAAFEAKHKIGAARLDLGMPKEVFGATRYKELGTLGEQMTEVVKKKGFGYKLPKGALTQKEALIKLASRNVGGVCQLFRNKGGRIGFAAGSSCAAEMSRALDENPIQVVKNIRDLPGKTGALNQVKNAATTFLGMLGRGGLKVAPYAAIAAVGAAAEPLVKKFMADDPTTYLTNENQMKGMLLATLEGEPPKVDEEILKWQYPGMAASAAAAIPGSSAMMKARRAKGFGTPRAALGPVGKFLAGSFSPLGVAATLPLHIAAQRKGGTDWGDIATDPMNWMAPAFASSGAKMATRGMAPTGILAKAIRMGMSPRALMLGSRFLGWPGLALTAGMWGYDKWKNRDRDD